MSFLTFDLGTTLYKIALFDDHGRLVALERARPPIREPEPGWVEVDGRDFVRAICDALARLRGRATLEGVEAVSIATQANSFLLTDEAGEPVTPFILWSDERAGPQDLGELRRVVPDAGPLLALAKLVWLKRNRPDVVARARRLIFIGDYLAGGRETEAGVATIARLFDPRQPPHLRACGNEILRQLSLGHIALPHVVRTGTDLGPGKLLTDLGIDPSAHLVMGCLDQYAGAIGTGTVTPGAICETTGTVLSAVRCAAHFEDHPAASVVQGPGWDEQHVWQMSFSSTSANLLEWYRNSLPDKPSYEALSLLAGEARDSGLRIEPYEPGSPIAQCFRHVRPEHTRGEVVRAIMNRVAESLGSQVNDLSGGEVPREIRSAGGAARSDVWLAIKAARLGTTFVATECEEPTSLGAAMLAASARGHGTLHDLAQRWVRLRART